jgi:hypothetical protein
VGDATRDAYGLPRLDGPNEQRAAAADGRTVPAAGDDPNEPSRPAHGAHSGPRVWDLPPEPGPEVTAVRTARGILWRRDRWGWSSTAPARRNHAWSFVLCATAWEGELPLTDATGEA